MSAPSPAATRTPHPPFARAAALESPPTSALGRQRSMPKVKIATDEVVSNLAATLSSTSRTHIMPLTSFSAASAGRAAHPKRKEAPRMDKYAKRYQEIQSLTQLCRALRGLLYGVPDQEHKLRQEIATEEARTFQAIVGRAAGAAAGIIGAERRRDTREHLRTKVQRRRDEVSVRRSSPERSSLASTVADVTTHTSNGSFHQVTTPSPRSRMLLLFSTPVNPGMPPTDVNVSTTDCAAALINRSTTPVAVTPQGWIPSPSPIGRRHRHMTDSAGSSPRMTSSLY